MVANKLELSVRAAVMSCLARCSESEAPLCCLGEFLEKLTEMGWNDDDVRTVQASVVQLLTKPLQTNHPDSQSATLAATDCLYGEATVHHRPHSLRPEGPTSVRPG
jgi:hypothetical protein